MTRRVINTFLENINTRVPIMVTTPEKSCVKPKSKPSERVSASAITRLMISPVLCLSR